ncbi:3'-5' exonuclease [Leptospira kirschneri]|uniref:3'-5' exonuclease n=1 Tax=Leptospira kirschneri TaxID=29507 RepID=UPI003563545B
MIILGLDFETNGLDPNKCDILEFGAVLWDLKKSKPLYIASDFILPDSTHFEIEEDIKILTGIEEEDLYSYGIPIVSASNKISEMTDKATCIVTHFGIEFDRVIYERLMNLVKYKNKKVFWIDTGYDIAYSKNIRTRKLNYLSFEHGLMPFQSHRALFDVLTMLNILSKYNIDEIIQFAQTPLLRVTAHLDFDKKDLAIKSGFYWNKEKKIWVKVIREGILKKENLDFKIEKEIIYQNT